MPQTVAPSNTGGKMPPQIPYIIGNEACERFSFYGMRNILTPFLVTSLLLYAPLVERAGIAKEVFHSFVIGVYFFPLLGGWISDRFFGKYHTVLWLSLLYCIGQGFLAFLSITGSGFTPGCFSLLWARAASSRWCRRLLAINSIKATSTRQSWFTTFFIGRLTLVRSSHPCSCPGLCKLTAQPGLLAFQVY